MELATEWARARAGDPSARARLIERYAGFARAAARRVGLATTVADREDMEAIGLLGLVEAVDRFDPDRGVPFEAFALRRIRGAVIDQMRHLRPARRTDPESAPRLLSLDRLVEEHAATLPSAGDGLDERFEAEDLRERVYWALGSIRRRDREVLARYYGQNLTLRETGARMGITEARVSQLHERAVRELRVILGVVAPHRGPAAA